VFAVSGTVTRAVPDAEPRRSAARDRIEAAVLSLIAAAPVLATAIRAADTWRPVGDTAAIALRASDVFGRHSPLVGMPTTLSDTVGQTVHHPGPLEFWVIAVGQLVSGHRLVPMLAVAAVNVLAIVAIVVLAGWLGGRNGRLLAALVVVACTWSLRGDYLIDPYNPYAAWLPLGAFAVALVCVLAERWWALPVAVGFGSYAAQSHVSLLVPVTVCVLAAIGLGGLATSRHLGGPGSVWERARRGASTERRPLLVALTTASVCSAPILVDLAVGRHNLFTLVRATGSDGPILGLSRAWQVTARALTSPPWLEADRSPFDTLAPVGGPGQLLAVVGVAVAVALVIALWERQHPSAWAIVVALAGLAGGTVAASRIPGGIFAAYALHNYLWLWVFTALFWAGLLAGVWAWLTAGPLRSHAGGRHLAQRGPVLALAGAVALASVAVFTPAVRPSVLAGRHAPSVGAIAAQLVEELTPGERVVVGIDAELDQSAVAMGLVRELEVRGFVAFVDPGLGGSFGTHRVVDGEADTRLVVVVGRVGPPDPSDPALTLVATYEPEPGRAVELAQANSAIETRIVAEGGATIGIDGIRLDPDEAVTLVRTGDLVGLGRLGLVAAPPIPADEFRRYADAQEGPILHVHVYRASDPRR
jgi:hypothetical protein